MLNQRTTKSLSTKIAAPRSKPTSLYVSPRVSLRNDWIRHRHKQGKDMLPTITNRTDSLQRAEWTKVQSTGTAKRSFVKSHGFKRLIPPDAFFT